MSHPTGLLDDLRADFDFVRISSLMHLIAYSSILFSVLFFTIAFPFNKMITTSFPHKVRVLAIDDETFKGILRERRCFFCSIAQYLMQTAPDGGVKHDYPAFGKLLLVLS